MEVRVKFMGIPDAVKAVGSKEVTAEIDEPTLGALLRQLQTTYGAPLQKAIFTQRGAVDHTIQLLRNGADFVERDALDLQLEDGDQLTFLMMMAGG